MVGGIAGIVGLTTPENVICDCVYRGNVANNDMIVNLCCWCFGVDVAWL